MGDIKTSRHVDHYCRLHASGALEHRCSDQCEGCRPGRGQRSLLVKTDVGRKGLIYYRVLADLKGPELEVAIVGDDMKPTGEKIVWATSRMTALAHND